MFEKIKTNPLRFKVGDLPNKRDEIFNLPAATSGFYNQGLTCFVPRDNATVVKNAISVAANGNGSAYYQPYDFTILQDSYAIKLRADFEPNREQYLCLVTALQKVIQGNYDWNNKAGWEKIKSDEISLPVNDNGEPDFDYMEAYIAYIEREYILELEAERELYLKACLTVAKIKSYKLGANDEAVLALKPPRKEFKVEDLFDTIKRGRRIKSLDRIKGDLPFITAGVNERGFSSYIGNPEAEVFPENSLTIDMFGTVFYRNFKYGADDHVAVLYNKAIKYDEYALLYIGKCIEKSVEGKFSYSKNFYASDAYEVIASLPVNAKGEPDFEYMGKYIKAMQKLVASEAIGEFDLKLSAAYSLILF